MGAERSGTGEGGGRRVRVRRRRTSKSPLRRLGDIAFLLILAAIAVGAGLAWLLMPPSGEPPPVEAPAVEG